MDDLSRPFTDGSDPMAAIPADRLLISHPAAGPVAGRWDLPGDRTAGLSALACAALALGRSTLRGLVDTAETRAFRAALMALGVGICSVADDAVTVQGRGVGGLAEPDRVLATGGSGTVAALLLGMVASQAVVSTIDQVGPYDLVTMDLTAALSRIGARLALRSGGRLPGTIMGAAQPLPARHAVSGEWQRAAVLLAGLNIPGRTTVQDDVTGPGVIDGLLAHFGAIVGTDATGTGVTGHAELSARTIDLPGDADLASMALLAALARPGGSLTLPRVSMDWIGPTLLPALRRLGADIQVADIGKGSGLSVADLHLNPGRLSGAVIDLSSTGPWARALPFVMVAAGLATGQTRLTGAGRMRERVDHLMPALLAAGIDITWQGDALLVGANGASTLSPLSVQGDLPLALALLARGCRGPSPLAIAGAGGAIDRYPGLIAGFNALGGSICLGV